MILLDILPCSDCVFYMGIKQPSGAEKDEYVSCDSAKSGNANELLYFKNEYLCPKYKSEGD